MILLWFLVIAFTLGITYVLLRPVHLIKTLGLFLLGGLASGLILGSIRVIPAGRVGVEDFFGRVSDGTLSSGFHVVNPLSKVVLFSLRSDQIEQIVSFRLKDHREIIANILLRFSLDPRRIPSLYEANGTHFKAKFIQHYLRRESEAFFSVMTSPEWTEQRNNFEQLFQDKIATALEPQGILVEEVQIR